MSNSHSLQAEIELIRIMKSGIVMFDNNIVFETDPDYATVNSLIAKQKLPLLFMVGPIQTRNPVFTGHAKPTVRFGDLIPGTNVQKQFRAFNAEDDVDFTFETTILTDRKSDMTNAMDNIYGFFLNGKKIVVEKSPGLPEAGTIEYEVDLIDKFIPGKRLNNSGLKESQGTIIIRGVKISDGGIFQEGFVAADEPILDTVKK